VIRPKLILEQINNLAQLIVGYSLFKDLAEKVQVLGLSSVVFFDGRLVFPSLKSE
jgi:hypothetical protein